MSYPNKAIGTHQFQVRACAAKNICGPVDSQTIELKYHVPATISGPETSRGSYTLTWPLKDYVVINENGSDIESNYYQNNKSFTKENGTYTYKVDSCILIDGGSDNCTGFSARHTVEVLKVPSTPGSINNPANSNSSTVNISWGASSGTVHRYKVYTKIGAGAWGPPINSGTTTTHSFSNLGDGTYQFKVEACNTLGTESCSSSRTSSTTVIAKKPSNPGAFTPVATPDADGSFTLRWGAAGGNVDGYELYVSENGGSSYSSAAIQNSGSLTKAISVGNGSYRYRVRARNDEGSYSAYSDYIYSNVIVVQPPAPTSAPVMTSPAKQYSKNPNEEAIKLSWNAVSGASFYQVSIGNSGNWVDSGSNTFKNFIEQPYGTYTYYVRACSAPSSCGPSGQQSIEWIFLSESIISGPVTSRGSFTLSWPLRDYVILYENGEEADPRYTQNDKVFSKEDGSYEFRIISCVSTGSGPDNCTGFSPRHTVEVLKVPTEPTSFAITQSKVNSADFSVSWAAPLTGIVEKYKFYKRQLGEQWKEPLVDGLIYGTNLSGLLGGNYEFKVEACNSLGTDEECKSTDSLLLNIPEAPPEPTATVEGNVNRLDWSFSSEVSYYEVDVKFADDEWFSDGKTYNTSPAIWNDLAEGSRIYRIRACNAQNICSKNSPVSNNVETLPLEWIKCANEGQYCSFLGDENVRYGANNTFVEKALTDGTLCSNSIFSDPLYGVVKACYLLKVPAQIPDVPKKPSVFLEGNANTLAWLTDFGASYYEISVQFNDNPWSTLPETYTDSPITWSNLNLGTRKYRVRACNVEKNCSEYSESSDSVETIVLISDFINFYDYDISSYGVEQDISGTAVIKNSGAGLELTGNVWKKIDYPYQVTEFTVIEFDFLSTIEGEIHSIGLDKDLSIADEVNSFQVFGTQNWGLQDYQTYTAGSGVSHYSIPIGEHYLGEFNYLYFVMDEDRKGKSTSNSTFSNIRIYEKLPGLPSDYPDSSYAFLNERWVGSSVEVVGMLDNTTLNYAGKSHTINSGESFSYTVQKQGESIYANKPFAIGTEAEGLDMPVPYKFLGDKFVIPHIREGHYYYLFSPIEDAFVVINVGETSHNITLTAGEVYRFNAGTTKGAGTIDASIPILVSHSSIGNSYDPYPVPQLSKELWGVRSQQAYVGAFQNNTTVSVRSNSGGEQTFKLNAGEVKEVTIGFDTAEGRGGAIRLTSDKPISAVQHADGDGYDSTAFLPEKLFSKKYVIPVDAHYIALVCNTDTLITLTTTTEVQETVECNSDGIFPGKAYFGDIINSTNIRAGSEVVANHPVYLIYETAVTNDEHNLLGYTEKEIVQVTYPSNVDGSTTSSGAAFIVAATPTDSDEASIQKVEVSINNTDWFTALFFQDSYQHNFGLLAAGEYQLRVRVTLTNGEVIILNNEIHVENLNLWSDFTKIEVDNDPSFIEKSVPFNDVVGTMPGKASVSGGQANYNIPLQIAPGRNDLKPNISLQYSSSAGNSSLGVGWSLSAISSIQRCSSTLAQDGRIGAVLLDANDKLCLDGKRLIVTSGGYGKSGAEYHTEIDTFARITQSGELSDNGVSFTVETRDGRTNYYGHGGNSVISPSGLSQELGWLINKSSDASGNNTIEYSYLQHGDGEVHVEDIFYTGKGDTRGNRKVHFSYELRPDIQRKYLAGGLIISSLRLNRITNSYGTQILWDYDLTYEQSRISNRSLLTKIQACDGNLNCLPPTTFQWPKDAHSFVHQPLSFDEEIAYPGIASLDAILPRGDINGDGVRDWRGVFVNAEGQKVGTTDVELRPCYKNPYLRREICIDADFNLDGRTDDWRENQNELQIKYSGSTAWVSTSIALNTANPTSTLEGDHIRHVADYNGDGWPDLMLYVDNNGSPELHLHIHTGNTLLPFRNDYQIVYRYGVTGSVKRTLTNGVQFMGDMDGNGLPDLISFETGANTGEFYPQPRPVNLMLNMGGSSPSFVSTNLNFASTSSTQKVYFSYFIDINGDNLSDWLGWSSETNSVTDNELLRVRFNKGSGQFSEPKVIDGARFKVRSNFIYLGQGEPDVISFAKFGNHFKVVDINGDGKVEILTPGARIIEACADVQTFIPGTNNKRVENRCGEGLYGFYLDSNFNRVMVDSDLADDSIYQFDALYFDENSDGGITMRRENTELYGHVSQSGIVDAFGKGLPDMVSIYRKRNGVTFNGDASGTVMEDFQGNFGAYISRNLGPKGPSDNYSPIDMLQSVTNGQGVHATWTYRPLSSDEYIDFYDTDFDYTGQFSTGNGEYFHFTSSMYVVAEFIQDSGSNFETNQQLFRYQGAVYNIKGRGFQGFREIEIEDATNGLTSISRFHQTFPKTGLLQSLMQYALNDYGTKTLIEATDYTWQLNHAHRDHFPSTTYHLYDALKRSYSYDLNTGLQYASSSHEISDIDAYGNIIEAQNTHSDEDGNTYQTSISSTWSSDSSDWFINRLNAQTKSFNSVERPGGDPIAGVIDIEKLDLERSTTVIYENYNEHRKPTLVTFSASDSDTTLVTTSEYNQYGLAKWVEKQGQVFSNRTWDTSQSRKTIFAYSEDGSSISTEGYFPFQATNALGHTITTTTDVGLGRPLTIKDANEYLTSYTYDGFGRTLTQTSEGKPIQYIGYQFAGNNAPSGAVWQSISVQAGAPDIIQYFDKFDRLLRTATEDFDGGGYYFSDVEYNERGLKSFQSQPYRSDDNRYGTSFGNYDALGRLKEKTIEQVTKSLVTTYQYEGHTTKLSVGGLPEMSRSYNSFEQLVKTEDSDGNITLYAYDNMGNPIVIRDADNNDIKALYNGFGFKLYVEDPNMGRTDYLINSFGELENEKDANGDEIDYQYDLLGRITSRATMHQGAANDSYATFDWDVKSDGCKFGLICSESEKGMSRTYQYDSALRVTQTTTTLDGANFISENQFDDNFGRPIGLVYPNGLTLAYEYNAQGYLVSEKNAASSYIYRTIEDMDAFGNISSATMSDGLLTGHYLYSQKSAQMLSSTITGSQRLHELYYTNYDEFGNIIEQSNLVTGTSERFTYDNLQRLTNNVAEHAGSVVQAVSYGYDAIGNFKYKSDYSTTVENAYQYIQGEAGPNAVTSVIKPNGLVSFKYDAKGNMISGDGLTATYTAYGKPEIIAKNGKTSNFAYGSDRLRYKQESDNDSIYYIDKLSELEGKDWRIYISDVAVIKYKAGDPMQNTSQSSEIRFLHRDRLGSATTLTDHNGQVTERRRFDPFGKPRGISSESLLSARISSFGSDSEVSKRGFTDHEHLDEHELIHMNGRVYDYNLGRFLSVDPLVQAPTNSQSLNPYSYIMNNPLSGTDPTGYCSTTDTMKDCAGGLEEGKTQAITNSDGKTVGYVGKDSKGNVHITNNGASKGQTAVSNSIASVGKPNDINSQNQVARSDPQANRKQDVELNGSETACAPMCVMPSVGTSALGVGGALGSPEEGEADSGHIHPGFEDSKKSTLSFSKRSDDVNAEADNTGALSANNRAGQYSIRLQIQTGDENLDSIAIIRGASVTKSEAWTGLEHLYHGTKNSNKEWNRSLRSAIINMSKKIKSLKTGVAGTGNVMRSEFIFRRRLYRVDLENLSGVNLIQ
ncbi:hypothetical protein GCM10011274_39440 [Paraglaciecola chathamensis]|uniref:Fibronectin type-III domain-containing protein n=1 Tax=Paraglaciecola chathamensis TaxID=368405 RepID=A0A8H9LY46_9ALTE|nr:hypothetical protein GCM10011274_39440 [Paraglaciecola oceanifecundans]